MSNHHTSEDGSSALKGQGAAVADEPSLKLCPFCGGKPRVSEGMGEFRVSCMSCRASSLLRGNREATVNAWNTRAVNRDHHFEALVSLLEDCGNLLTDQYSDVEDGDYGQPRPNRAMRMAQEITETLAAISLSEPMITDMSQQDSKRNGQAKPSMPAARMPTLADKFASNVPFATVFGPVHRFDLKKDEWRTAVTAMQSHEPLVAALRKLINACAIYDEHPDEPIAVTRYQSAMKEARNALALAGASNA